jgi:hypothetical protein
MLNKKEGPFTIRAATERLFFDGPRVHSDDAPGNKVRKGIQVPFANLGIEILFFIQGEQLPYSSWCCPS